MNRPIRISLLIVLMFGMAACNLQNGESSSSRQGADREAALHACLRMLESANPSERQAGARELGRPDLADPVAFQPLCRLLHDDSVVMVRRHAAFALRAAAYVEATDELVQCILFDQDQNVRLDAMHALRVRRDPAAMAMFEGLLANRRETPAFREEVVETLGAYRTRDAMNLLCRAAAFEHSVGPVREQALDQLAEQGCEAVPYFLDYLQGEGFVIASSVVDEMRRDDPDSVMPQLVRAYRQKARAAGYGVAQRGQLFP